jgi:mannose-6-phosphate isomerase-like protein (cupin superfamily)
LDEAITVVWILHGGQCRGKDGHSPAGQRFGEKPEGSVFKIMHLEECAVTPMAGGRGEQIKLINPGLGTEKLDVHFNRLRARGPRGKRHRHTNADNVYIVKRGEGTLTVEGNTHVIRENDVVYIPAGMTHSLSNLSDKPFEIFEIYAPAGRQFDVVADE